MSFTGFVSRHVVPVFLYLPGEVPRGAATPAAAGLPHGEEVAITTEDGVGLHAWWVPARPGGGEPGARRCGSVVYFHGNAGSLVERGFIADRLSRRGFDALLVDYRGYGRSGGAPGEEGLYADGRAALRHVREARGVPAGRIALAGHSLGSAVAARVAAGADPEPGAVVLTGAFRTMPELARHAYPLLPAPLFRGWTTNRFDLLSDAGELEPVPTMVARGGLDTLVPRAHTRSVFEALPGPRRWHEATAAGHDDLWDDEGFWRELDAFLRRSLGCTSRGGAGPPGA